MAGLNAVIVTILIATSYFVSADVANYRNEESIKWLIKTTAREAEKTSEAVRNVTIKEPACKVELSNMANGFLASTCHALYSLNTVIPNIVNEDSRKILINANNKLSEMRKKIHDAIHRDPEILKAALVSSLDGIKEGAVLFGQRSIVFNRFAANQVVKSLHHILYGIYKLKYEATYFKDTNKQLGAVINGTLGTYLQAIVSLPESENTVSTLHELMEQLAVITERAVYKLYSWTTINANDTANVEIAKEVSRNLSSVYHILHRGVSGPQISAVVKAELHSTGVAAGTGVERLTQITYPDNQGGQEFIRDIIFDCIAITAAYGENLKNVSNTVQN